MRGKGKITTRIAIIGGLFIFALLIALFMDKITADDLWKGLTSVGLAMGLFIGYFSKDYNQSHSKTIIDADNPKNPPKKE